MIKKLTAADITQAFLDAYDKYNPLYHKTPDMGSVVDFVSNSNNYFFVAFDESEIQGHCYGYYLQDMTPNRNTSFIWAMAVSEKYRRKGIGTQLVNKVKEDGIFWNCSHVFLTTQTDNPEAIDFYKKLGAKINNKGEDVNMYFYLL